MRNEETFKKVFRFMSKDEKETYLMYSLCGQYIASENMILMGSEAMDRVIDYENKMIDKYKSKS